jgi:ankyrin repeat protein
MCSFLPLKSHELVAAVCQDPDGDDIQPVDIDIDFVLYACRNLLVVDPQLDTCGFSHLSAQEYLESRAWSLSQAHAHAAKACLVMFIAEERRCTASSPVRNLAQMYAAMPSDAKAHNAGLASLLTYALYKWPRHVQKHGEDDVDPNLARLLKAFLGSMDAGSGAFQHWFTLYREEQGSHYGGYGQRERLELLAEDYGEVAPPSRTTFAICYFGFHKILAEWWKRGPAQLLVRNARRNTLLHLAVKSGSYTLTQRLVDLGLDVNSPGSANFGSPLTIAAGDGSIRILQLLLIAGAVVNAGGGWYGCSLCAAARTGHIEAVQLLLAAGADVRFSSDVFGSPLCAAVAGKHTRIVQLLLEAGANVNVHDDRHRSPLCEAALARAHEVVRLLLHAGAVVDQPDRWFGSPLGAAVACGDVPTARLLLAAHANVNLRGGEYGSPLATAASYGRTDTLELLLRAGASVNLPGGAFGSPLGAAAYEGKTEAARRLLDAGADANMPAGRYGTPLGAAAKRGHIKTVELLLARGGDVACRGGQYARDLLARARDRRGVIARLQLDTSFTASRAGYALNAAISSAAMSPYGFNLEVVKLLLRTWAAWPVQARGIKCDEAVDMQSSCSYTRQRNPFAVEHSRRRSVW